MFSAHPKTHCPHLDTLDLDGICERFSKDVLINYDLRRLI
jgi:hypothetical protein